uniref:Uncharacterized protein n=1 Tax=Sphaerodactylus townsendi TaxID=933632 RepID=A0ACB8EEY2_9SAUR
MLPEKGKSPGADFQGLGEQARQVREDVEKEGQGGLEPMRVSEKAGDSPGLKSGDEEDFIKTEVPEMVGEAYQRFKGLADVGREATEEYRRIGVRNMGNYRKGPALIQEGALNFPAAECPPAGQEKKQHHLKAKQEDEGNEWVIDSRVPDPEPESPPPMELRQATWGNPAWHQEDAEVAASQDGSERDGENCLDPKEVEHLQMAGSSTPNE